MEIHINTGNGMENRESLERWADGEIRKNLVRFTEGVRRVEVHLSDVNHGKGGADDKRCVIEAMVPQHAPVVATHNASTVDEAFRGAEAKLQRALGTALGKLKDLRDRTSIRNQPELLQP